MRLTILCAVAAVLGGCAVLQQSSAPATQLEAHVVRISEEYANINTDLHADRVRAAGIQVGDDFIATFGDREVEVVMGEGYGDVPRGDWVWLIEDDGTLQLAISFGHAADVIGCAVGDRVIIEAVGDE